MQIRTLWQPLRKLRVRILCPVVLFESWLPVAAAAEAAASPCSPMTTTMDDTHICLTCGLCCYSNKTLPCPHPFEVCKRWLIGELFKRIFFFCLLFKKRDYVSLLGTCVHSAMHASVGSASIQCLFCCCFFRQTHCKGGCLSLHKLSLRLCVAGPCWLAPPHLPLPTAILDSPHQPLSSSILQGSPAI